ncbi:MgtC/SapB family protein [Moraxella lincolnii]|uniref:Protein MgtC n=1 Tax=Lwoffella lincolnii TaxID=90241 RepID=A0A1T0CI22_9GAMM|nr:MgtC/SapB family protein [Moraxella lincolnii]OOS21791.1 magnesium transporter MgtC [Moraxella lincolnii]
MNGVLAHLFDFDLDVVITHTVQMVIAFVLVLPIGYHRENSSQSIGLRTFPLVSLASCGFTLIGLELLIGQDDGAAGEILGGVIGGVVTGIGFIGGGAILKQDGMVEGTSTAAAIWSAGCIGVSVAMGRLELAVILSVFTFLVFYFVSPLKSNLEDNKDGV